MIMIRKKILLEIMIYFLTFHLLYSQVVLENIEDVYLQITAEKLINDFYMIKYDVEKDEPYIGLISLFYFLELYNLEVDIKDYRVTGKIGRENINISFSEEEAFVDENNELYVKISSVLTKLNFKSIKFDMETLTLNLEPNFMLPYQEKEAAKVERLRLDGIKEKEEKAYDIEMERKYFTPGLLKVNYSLNDIKSNEQNLSFEYGSQFLLGELYILGELKPEEKLNTGRLTYSNIIDNNNLTFGNINVITPKFINLDSEVLGVSVDDYDTYLQTENNQTIIRWQIDNVDSIELYRNGILVDYRIKPPREDYFIIADGMTNAEYLLKIYYTDGKVEERMVYSLNDINALKKGKYKPIVQIGKTENRGDFQTILKGYYGFTDKLTLGGGYSDLIDYNGRNLRLLEQTIIYNTRNLYYPTVINLTNYYEVDEGTNGYEMIINQKVGKYNLRFIENKYSNYLINNNGTEKYNSLSLTRSFDRNSFELGFSKQVRLNDGEEEKIKNIYGGWYNSYFSPFYISLNIEKEIDGDDKVITYSPKITYSRGVSLILDGNIETDERTGKLRKEEYRLRLNKRRIELIDDRLYGDLAVEAIYDARNSDYRYGITFSIDLEDYINIGVDHNIDFYRDESIENRTSLTASKVINLASPLKKVDNDIPVNSYTVLGKIFLDRNGNGIYDSGDTPLEGVGIFIDGVEFKSDKYGNYLGDGVVFEDVVEIEVNRKTMDPMYKNTKGALKVKPLKSATLKLDVPVEVVSMVTGNIWNTEKFTEREFIQNISMTTIRLEKDGKVYKEIDPEFDGLFFFEDIAPGEYDLKFIYLGEENIRYSPENIKVNVKLQDPEVGEYFEGNDTLMIRDEEEEEIIDVETDIIDETLE